MPSISSSITPAPSALDLGASVIASSSRSIARREQAATLLVVEPDPFVRELLTAGLELHQPAWRVEALADAGAAAARLAGSAPLDLLLLELALPEPRRGAALVQQARGRIARLPVLLLTSMPEEAWRRGLDVDAMLVKPPDMDQLLPRVERLLALYRGSILRGIALPTLLQMLEAERKDCTLTVAAAGASGRIWVREGKLVFAECGDESGPAAFFAMLDWPAPVVEVADRCDLAAAHAESLQELLLEHAIASDQRRRA